MTGDGATGPGGPPAPARPFVGRRRELGAFERAWRRVEQGEPAIVLVEGDAGLGKSALLREAQRRLPASATVLRASGAEIEQGLDLGVLEQLVVAAGRAGRGDGAPSVATGDRWRREDARPDALQAGSVLLDHVTALVDRGPVVMALDDAHWCDLLSLDALAYVARRLGGRPVLLVAAHRPVAGDLEPLDRLCRDGWGERIRISPMDPEALGELIATTFAAPLPTPAVERLHAHTRGSPLDALAVVDELGVAAVAAALGTIPAPRSFGLLMLSRLASCPPGVEAVVAATAVYGHALTIEQLAGLLAGGGGDESGRGPGPGDGPATVPDALVEQVAVAVDRGLLAETTVGGRPHVDVAHPLVRSAVVDDLPPGRRADFHRRAARVTSDPVRAMVHRLHGTVGTDEDLAAEAVRLAEARLAAAWELEGVGLLTGAATVTADAERRSELLLRAASRLAVLGDDAAATDLLDRVPAGRGGVRRTVVLGQLALAAGDGARARELLLAAWDAGPPADLAGLVAGLLATGEANAGRYAESLEWATRALAVGDTSGDVGHPLVMLASGAALDGDLGRARAVVDEWRTRVTGPAARADAAVAAALVELWSGRSAEAVATLARLLEAGTRVPFLTRATAQYTAADAAYRLGDWDRAVADAERLASVLVAAHRDLAAPMAHSVAAFVHAARGAFDRARVHLDAGRAAFERTGNANSLLWLWVAEGRLATARGDAGAVVATLLPLADLLAGFRLPDEVQPWRADLVEALVAVGDLDAASVHLASLEADAGACGAPTRLRATRVGGVLAAARGDAAGASARFAAGLADPERARAGRFVLARLDVAAGLHELRHGDPAEGARRTERGIAALDDLGAVPFAARARAAFAHPGSGADDGPTGGPPEAGRDDGGRLGSPPLTKAERAVVELVASGLTNRETADALFVSVKTVETHLGRAYAKLGVRSRTELAVRWHRPHG